VSDTFNVASGTTSPIAVTSQSALMIGNDTFTVGASASLLAVVVGETNAGAITLANDDITVAGKVDFDGIILFSDSGLISLSSNNLNIAGTDSGNGIDLMTAGDVTVSSTTVNLSGATTGTALEVTGGDCSLSNIAITAGSSLGTALEVTASGDLSLTGTNSVTVAGAVATGVDLTATANATVSNLTAKFENNITNDAVDIFTPDMASISNINLTVVGNVGDDGINTTDNSNAAGSLLLNNVSVLLEGSAVCGVVAGSSGNLNVTGTESVTVNGAAGTAGMVLSSQMGNITVSTGLNVKLGSTATYGLEVNAEQGNLTITGPVVVQVSGAVTDDGVSIVSGNLLSVGAFTVTLDSTTEFGIEMQAAGVSVAGPLNLKIVGAVASDGLVIESDSDAAIADPISVTLESNALNGLDLDAAGTLTVAGAIDLNVTGSISSNGILIEGDQITRLSGSVKVTIQGGAGAGLQMASEHGSIIATSGIAVNVVGPTSGNVSGIVTVAASTSATLANVKVTAKALENEAGLVVAADTGPLTVSNVQVIASGGSPLAGGIDLDSQGGSVAVSDVNFSMSGQADFGLKVRSQSAATVANATVTVSGAIAGNGIDIGSQGTVNLAGLSAILQNSAGVDGINVFGAGVNVTGAIAVHVTGALSSDGISIDTSSGSLAITAPISVNLGSTASYGLNFDSISAISDTGTLTVNVVGNVSDAGASLEAGTGLTIGGNTTATLGGTAGYGLDATTIKGSLKNTAPITVSVAGVVSDASAAFSGACTLNNLNLALSKGSTNDGLDVGSPTGNLNLTNTTLKITGPVTGAGLSLIANQGNISTTNLNINLSATVGNGIDANAANGNLSMTGTTLIVSGNVSNGGVALGAGSSLNLQTTNVTLKGTSSFAFDAGGGTLSVSGLNLQETGAIAHTCAYLESSGGNTTISSSTITLGSTTNVGLDISSQGDETLSGVSFKEAGFATVQGVGLSSQGNLSATGDNFTFSKGTGGSVLEVDCIGGNAVFSKDSFAANATVSAGIEVQANGSLTLENTSVVLNSGATIGALLYSNAGNPQIIENDTFSTSGKGTGLILSDGVSGVALVQDNNFQNNLVGVEISGDGTDVGEIDLGGGTLGSLGGNNFKGYTGSAGNYAIELTNTNSAGTVYALDNLFSVTNPLTVIQDGTHNTNGTGTGVIAV
jgi:filamentous hemagglutinin